ncbi:CPBP family intramembrane metalloprotease [Pseudomonas sp. MM211]|uniref:CPBP family intramembrane glutamic endopeptidase n=1 Tax=Pseudomonas sp. MM211 TaxID=2866808 RepID=UPI001CEC30C5|nr:CPBP family intramembrane glutamic endopeptidase [Pseudomonas sp. MM211]UCJ15885.1 CPBP family intramembrane metalloprotease [Pseudomonas sp. MM211]
MPLSLRLLLPLFPLATGVILGFIEPVGLLVACLFIALVFVPDRLPARIWHALVMIASLLLAAHLLPGFEPWIIREPERVSSDAPPYLLRLSWDKLLVGCTLLAWWIGLPSQHGDKPMLAIPASAATLLAVPTLALLLGVVAWQPKWPDMLWPWLIVNVGVAVLAEELLFRGLLQRRLVEWLGAWPGILCASLLFGAAHIPFSPGFAVVATVAGVGYGLAFHLTGRLSVAIALHGLVNLLHFTLLSYPIRLG